MYRSAQHGRKRGSAKARFLNILYLGSFLTSCAIAAGPRALAETAKSDDHSTKIEAVIVTSTRRNTVLQQTPVAENVVSGATLAENRVDSLSDIARLAPSLTFTNHSKEESYLSIRGTTQNNDAAGADQGVTVFIDGVPMTGIGDNDPNLFDVSSVEVLRGPQGTLFGSNVTGGAVVIHTRAPGFKPEADLQATAGNNGLYEIRAYANGPLVGDELAGKISIDYRNQGNYINAPYLHGKTGGDQLFEARGQILYTPNNNFMLKAGVDVSSDTGPFRPEWLIGNFQPSLYPHLTYSPGTTNDGKPSAGDSRTGGAFVRMEYSAPFGTVTSITGYRYVNSFLNFSTTGDPYNTLFQYATQKDQQYSEEIHLASSTSGPFTYVTGVFLLNSMRYYATDFDVNLLPNSLLGAFVPPWNASPFHSMSHQTVYTDSLGLYGEASYAFTPELKLTLGGRYSVEEKSGHSYVFRGIHSPTYEYAARYSHTWSDFTPKVMLAYQANPDVLVYGSVTTGFKSGGYDNSGLDPTSLATPFKPEKVVSYEIGAKTSALDQRLVFDVAAYYAAYTDLQTNVFDPRIANFVTGNAAKANVPGVELDSTFDATQWLTLNGSYAYTDATYASYNAGGGDNYTGHAIPQVPHNQFHLGAEAHFEAAALGGGTIRFGIDVFHHSKEHLDDAADETALVYNKTGESAQINLHASWTSVSGDWDVLFWGKNITDERTLVNFGRIGVFLESPGEFFNPTDNLFSATWNSPATFGVTVTRKFE